MYLQLKIRTKGYDTVYFERHAQGQITRGKGQLWVFN